MIWVVIAIGVMTLIIVSNISKSLQNMQNRINSISAELDVSKKDVSYLVSQMEMLDRRTLSALERLHDVRSELKSTLKTVEFEAKDTRKMIEAGAKETNRLIEGLPRVIEYDRRSGGGS